jgi:hypothetical protein
MELRTERIRATQRFQRIDDGQNVSVFRVPNFGLQSSDPM